MQSKSYIEVFKESFPDAKELTANQRKNLLRMLTNVLVELRNIDSQKNPRQVFDLADAFHNLPTWLNLDVFSFEHFRMYLESYKHFHPKSGQRYLDDLEKIIKDENLSGFND